MKNQKDVTLELTKIRRMKPQTGGSQTGRAHPSMQTDGSNLRVVAVIREAKAKFWYRSWAHISPIARHNDII
jgi:hypothetical protein